MLGEKIDKGEKEQKESPCDDEKQKMRRLCRRRRYIDHQASIEATSMNHDGETDDASHLQKEKERDEKELNGRFDDDDNKYHQAATAMKKERRITTG